eukprot:TRINITY_DN4968_c0_g1_i1.p1 TRINITY_DN4968_c0_g1~~TRINITY_DN4968_c0_g1_i1.p1  ORF type:complete len:392 (+),score=128.58 TRINITY_DN4968_c0_g1_i1:147-1322(+)
MEKLNSDCLQYLFSFVPPSLRVPLFFVCKKWKSVCCEEKERNNSSPEWFCVTAARDGNLSLIKWAKENGFKLDNVKEVDSYDESEEGDIITSAASLGGHLEILKFARENSLFFNENTFNYSAARGHLDIFKWARENNVSNFESYGAMVQAAVGGHISIIEYCKNNDKEWDEYAALPLIAMRAAENGRLEVVKWAVDNKLPLEEESICSLAALNGHLDVIKYARSIGLSWNAQTCSCAAERGHRNVIEWARQNNCKWDAQVCESAAQGGQWEMLKWLREEGAPWDERVCSAIGIKGNLEMLKWAKNNGAPWDKSTTTSLAGSGNVEALKWAVDNAAPFVKEDMMKELSTTSNLNEEMVNYLVKDLGCNKDEILKMAQEEEFKELIALLSEMK